MKKMLLCSIAFTLFCSIISCAGPQQSSGDRAKQDRHFLRQEKFPTGDQVNFWIGGDLGGIKDTNTEEFVFNAPYKRVWSACKVVADRFDKVGKRPVINVNEKTGRIQIGKIQEDEMIGVGTGAWLDEFMLEATEVPDSKTKVSITRKVVKLESFERKDYKRRVKTYEKKWRTQLSNGRIERWVLTQIEDELASAPKSKNK